MTVEIHRDRDSYYWQVPGCARSLHTYKHIHGAQQAFLRWHRKLATSAAEFKYVEHR